MKQLWAPWRMEYIAAGNKKDGCVFCLTGQQDGLLLYKDPLASVMLNKYPYNNGHLLISPLRHVARITELGQDESAAIFRLLQHSTAILEKTLNPGGFNIGMNMGAIAGAGIAGHLHWHIVPRWNGDHNFMPVLSETRVISEHLEATRTKLAPFFMELENPSDI